MAKVNYLLKVLLLALTVSFVAACSDDDESTTAPITKPTTTTIQATELTVNGTLQKSTSLILGAEISAWSLGECQINVYLGTNVSEEYKIGEGKVNADGTYEYTLTKSMSTANTFDVAYNLTGVVVNPSNLAASIFPAKAYVVVDGEERLMFSKVLSQSEEEFDTDYYYYFYSADGSAKGDGINFAGDLVSGFDINCKKGWNLEEHKTGPSSKKTVSKLPNDAVTFIYHND